MFDPYLNIRSKLMKILKRFSENTFNFTEKLQNTGFK